VAVVGSVVAEGDGDGVDPEADRAVKNTAGTSRA
jgi:hypothetical protein